MLVRMTCIYEPDDLTETRMELLAAVSTDSDLYLAKVGHHDVLDPSIHKTKKTKKHDHSGHPDHLRHK